MLSWWDRDVVVRAVNGILDEMFIKPVSDNREQIQGIIENYLEQEYPEMCDIFDIEEILEEVIEDE